MCLCIKHTHQYLSVHIRVDKSSGSGVQVNVSDEMSCVGTTQSNKRSRLSNSQTVDKSSANY